MELNPDFREFLELLNKHEVHFLVVGGYAVNYHGYPRYTKDIDLWILLNDSNLEHLLAVLFDFGFGQLGLTLADFVEPDNVVQLGYEPYRIDLLVSIEGLEFEECYKNRSSAIFEGIKVDFVNIDDLIKAKLSAGRPQDIADADKLSKIKLKLKK